MNIEDNTHELFDRYIAGQMGEAERKEFSLQLDNDPELKKAFELHTTIVAGLRENRRQELKAYIAKNAKISVMGATRNRNLFLAAAAAITVFGVSYVVLQFMNKNNAENTALIETTDSAQVAANEAKNDTSLSSAEKDNNDKGLDESTGNDEEVPAIDQGGNKNLTLENNDGNTPPSKDYIASSKAPVFVIRADETDKNKIAAPTATARKVEIVLSKGEKNTYKYNKEQLVLYTDNTNDNTLSKVAIYEMSAKSYLGYEKAYYPLKPDGRVNNLVKLSDAAILKKLPTLK